MFELVKYTTDLNNIWTTIQVEVLCQLAFNCLKSSVEHQNNMSNMFKVDNKDMVIPVFLS